MLIPFQGVRLLGLWLAVLGRVNCRCLVPNLLVSRLDKINSRLKSEEGQSAVLSLQKKICPGIRQSQAAVLTGIYNTSLVLTDWGPLLLIVSWLSKGRSACTYVCQPEDRKEGCGRQCSSSLGAGMAFCLLEGREQRLAAVSLAALCGAALPCIVQPGPANTDVWMKTWLQMKNPQTLEALMVYGEFPWSPVTT